MSGKDVKQRDAGSRLARAGAFLMDTKERRKSRQKKLKLATTLAGILVILLNMWRDHKEAIFRNK